MSTAILSQPVAVNRHSAKCAICGAALRPGEGVRLRAYYNRNLIYCIACNSYQQLLKRIEPKLASELRDIDDWIYSLIENKGNYGPASSIVENVLRFADLAALAAAQEYRDRMMALPEFTYGSFLALAWEIVREFQRMNDDPGECECEPLDTLYCSACIQRHRNKELQEKVERTLR